MSDWAGQALLAELGRGPGGPQGCVQEDPCQWLILASLEHVAGSRAKLRIAFLWS